MSLRPTPGDNFLVARIPARGGGTREIKVGRHRLHPELQLASTAGESSAGLVQLAEQVLEKVDGSASKDQGVSSRRVFVTSPGHDADKTITAFNLAWTLEQLGRSVLLVEANFSQPRFRMLLGDLRFRFGIDSALRGTVSPAEGVFQLGEGRLYLAGVRNAVAAGSLGSLTDHLESYWEWADPVFDVLVIDCPPVLSDDWREWLGAQIGPTLLVVREGQTPTVDIKAAVERVGSRLRSVYMVKKPETSTLSKLP